MKPFRLSRFARLTGLLAGVIIVITVGYIRAEQYVFRYRVERLVTDLRSLELRKTSPEDVQLLIQRWDFTKPAEKGTDESQHYYLQYQSLPVRLLSRIREPFSSPAARVMTLLGGRPVMVDARIEIRQNRAWSKEISVWLWTSVGQSGERILRGKVSTESSSWSESNYDRPADELQQRLRHHDYLVGQHKSVLNADTGPRIEATIIWAEYSAETDSSNGARLMRFNTACFTQFRACQDKDLMPSSWLQYVEDQQQPPMQFVCTPELSRQVAFLAEAIITVRVDSPDFTPTWTEGPPFRLSHFSMVRLIKGPQYLHRGLRSFIEMDSPEMATTADTADKVQSGKQYVLLLQTHRYSASDALAVYPCGLLSLNNATLALAQEAEAASEQAKN